FGLSLYPEREATRGLDAFSLEYAAPETLAAGEATPACDVYSLGATLYALAAGGAPPPAPPRRAPPAPPRHRAGRGAGPAAAPPRPARRLPRAGQPGAGQ